MSSPQKLVIYWCRRDFRLHDNPAFFSAVNEAKKSNSLLVPLYILDDGILSSSATHPNIGYPRRLFLSRVLAHFASKIPHFQILLGNPHDIFEKLSQRFEVQIFANEDVEPYAKKRDLQISKTIQKNGGNLRLFVDQLTIPREVRAGSGNLYSVFTPFKKAVWNDFLLAKVAAKVNPEEILKLPTIFLDFSNIQCNSESDLQSKIFAKIDVPWVFVVDEKSYNIEEVLGYDRPDYSNWKYREDDILQQFSEFVENGLGSYKTGRDELANTDGTSKMSVALKWGLISPRLLKNLIIEKFGTPDSDQFNFLSSEVQSSVNSYISELIWREFYRYILHHNPDVLTQSYQKKYQGECEPKWVSGSIAHQRFEAWMQGKTGYDLVDAGMKQLATTGWMHNRTRMVVGSILTKNLGVDWRWGQEYFRAMLLDLDEASNNGGWQWAASVGADPKPIRIFNPYLQERYDQNRAYIKKWLGDEPRIIQPIIEHEIARDEAKSRYNTGSLPV